MEEFLELFKGQISYEDLKYKLSYKEAIALKDSRIKRLERERKELEKERENLGRSPKNVM